MAGEHEGITCDQVEARAEVGCGRRRIVGTQGLEWRGRMDSGARPRELGWEHGTAGAERGCVREQRIVQQIGRHAGDGGDGEAKSIGKLG